MYFVQDLPSTVWKQLLGHKVEASDLEAGRLLALLSLLSVLLMFLVDKLCVQALDEIRALSADRFEYVVMQTFTTQLSDNTVTTLLLFFLG